MSLFYFNFDRETGKRYQVSRFMRFERGVYDFSTSYFLQEFMKLSPEGAYTILSVPQRPDVYSRDIYGNTDYWFLLLYYNNVTFLNELELGTSLTYPSISDMENIFFSLKLRSSQ